MKDSLVKESKRLEKIKFSQIATLIKILLESKSLEEEFIKRRFSRYSQDYECTRNFLIDIGLIKVVEKFIVVLDFKGLRNIDVVDEKEESSLKKYIITKLLHSSSSYKAFLESFLCGFSMEQSSLVFKPRLQERLGLSGIRNFLIEFRVIRFDDANNAYIIEKDFENVWHAIERTKVTLNAFLRKRAEEEKLGKKAELMILEFEKKRLEKYPYLVKEIKRISDTNLCAGYDIVSFEEGQKDKDYINRFIEVKAVSSENFHFYWSKNEIEMAVEKKEKYYLYLLPVIAKNKFDMDSLLVIRNPYKEIFINQHEWKRNIEKYSFEKSTGPH